MKTVVILNPEAGKANQVPRLRELLDRLPDVLVRETEGPGHARDLAHEAAEQGCATVVSAGGDGTLNEVLNGLAPDFSRSRLGVLPLGTGNDFVRSIGVPPDPEKAVEVLRAGHVRPVDVARATFTGDGGEMLQRYFLNMSAGGFSTAVGQAMDPELKQRWGALSYALSAAGALPELTPYRARLRMQPEEGRDGADAEEELEIALYVLIVANARYVASGIPAAPEARLDDGRLDVVAFPEMPPSRIAALIPQALLGRHPESDVVTVRRAHRLELEAEPPMPFNVDGEPAGTTPVTFEILPRALEVVSAPTVPPSHRERTPHAPGR